MQSYKNIPNTQKKINLFYTILRKECTNAFQTIQAVIIQ